MSSFHQDYALPRDVSVAQCIAALAQHVVLLSEPEQVLERTYLDTFDWRLHAAGGLLLAKRSPEDRFSLVWECDVAGKPLGTLRADSIPIWVSELPAGHLRDQLSRVVEMRALLPLARLRSRIQLVRVLNDDEKTVARLRFEAPRYVTPGGRAVADLPVRLTLVPVKGYPREANDVHRLLAERLSVLPVRQSLANAALAAAGRRAGDYSSKLRVVLRPDMRADEALQRILRGLLDTLQANVAGTKADIDSEFLHDLRVAVRRTRSALSQVKGVLPDAVSRDFKTRFAWLGQVTGPTRDLDVFILDFARYQHSLPGELQHDLLPLLPYLQEHQRVAQRALNRRLNAPHFHALLQDWRCFLDGMLSAEGEQGRHAARPIKALADRRIWRMYRRVRREGRAIDDRSPAEQLHELRKSCKKLRYLLEFFRSLYPPDKIKPLLKQLKRLLDNLGEFQDLHVQADKLRGFAADLQQQDPARLPTVLAIGVLIGDLLQRQQAERRMFAARFAAFDSSAQRTVCRELFKDGRAPMP
jgi:CHAD domain-containing protein